jgi:hypothetical protein
MLWLSHGLKLVKVCINSINLSLWISSTCQTFLRNVFFRGVLDNDIDWFLKFFFFFAWKCITIIFYYFFKKFIFDMNVLKQSKNIKKTNLK